MSTPMFEEPEHMLISVNENGDGPELNPNLIARWVCWCGTPGCKEYME